MAIIIPSKHIYDIQNQKVLNNQINSVTISINNIAMGENNGIIKSKLFSTENNFETNELLRDISTKFEPDLVSDLGILGFANFYAISALVEYNSFKYVDLEIYIPINLLVDIYPQTLECSCSIVGKQKKGVCSSIVTYKLEQDDSVASPKIAFYPLTYHDWEYQSVDITESGAYEIPIQLNNSETYYFAGKAEATQNLISEDNTNSFIVDKVIKDEKEYYRINMRVLCGIIALKSASNHINSNNYVLDWGNIDIKFNGEYIEYVPEGISISISGSWQEINKLSSSDIVLGNTDGTASYSLSSALIQQDSQEEIITNAQQIITDWKNGKETATIDCAIANYYDENGEIIVDIDNKDSMFFKLHQKAIPYIKSPQKTDVPMSKYKNGEPKVFEVISSEVYYNGVPRQKIVLQEVAQEENT